MNSLTWTPVSELLPAVNETVLVTCKTLKGALMVSHGSGSMAGVVAWQPMPEPYAGGGDC